MTTFIFVPLLLVICILCYSLYLLRTQEYLNRQAFNNFEIYLCATH